MTDNQYTPKEITPSPELDAPGETDDVAYLKGKGDFISAGQRIHKWSTYLGIDWIFNAFSGVSFAYFTKYTDFGKKHWSGPITNFFTKALSAIIKDKGMENGIHSKAYLDQINKNAAYGNIFMSVIAGGMFTLPPLLLLESKKVKRAIVEFFDRRIYGKDKVENDSRFKQSYEDMDNEPKKDFKTGLLARFAALAPLLAMVIIPKSSQISDKYYFEHVAKGSDVTARAVGFKPEGFKALPPAEQKERWNFIHRSIATDFGLGIPYAILHSFFYDMFARVMGKKGNPDASASNADVKASAELAMQASSSGRGFAQRVQSRAGVGHAEREAAREAEASNAPEPGAAR